MKKLIYFTLAALLGVSSFNLSAEPLQISNKSGTTLTVEILNIEGDQVTFTRTSDNQEFTLPIKLLEEKSQETLREWEKTQEKLKYQPDSAPFFKLDQEYVIPIDIEKGNVIFFDSNSQKAKASRSDAEKLQKLVAENKRALAKNPRKNLKSFKRIQTYNKSIIFIEDNSATTIARKDGKTDLVFWLNDTQTKLHEVSYEVFIPKETQASARFRSKVYNSHPLIEMFERPNIPGGIISYGDIFPHMPITQETGKWVKNKAIVRTMNYAWNGLSFKASDSTPIGIRNVSFKPVQPNKYLLRVSDLVEGYNLFTSNKPFKIEKEGTQSVKIKTDSELQYQIILDLGYEIEIEIEYENGEVTSNLVGLERVDPQVIKNINHQTLKRALGSRKEIKINFNSHGPLRPWITLRPGKDGYIKINRFDVSIQKAQNAAELNILHR